MNDASDGTGDAPRYALPSELLHDLRTPLNQIIGYSEMLAEDAQNAATLPHLKKISAAGYQMLALINGNFHSAHSPESDPDESGPTILGDVTGHQDMLSDDGEYQSASPARGFLLVVDDSEASRDVLSDRLRRDGYAVDMAENGPDALQKLRANDFDLVLLDVLMPDMDGYEVLKRLKADAALRHVPVIMISSLAELGSVARCIEMGADDYLTKPFRPILLKARVQGCLEKKRQRDGELKLLREMKEDYERLQERERSRAAGGAELPGQAV